MRNTSANQAVNFGAPKQTFAVRLKRDMRKNYPLHIMFAPVLLYFLLFKYLPIYGLLMAFEDYVPKLGVLGSKWVGLKHFEAFFTSPYFKDTLLNTLRISLACLLWGFPAPIVLALMLNEMRCEIYKKTVQTIIYIPHFLSWVVVGGLFVTILSPSSGIVNNIIKIFGGESIPFMTSNTWFRSVLVVSATWKEAGYNAVIYIAAISGISQEIYEAAKMDGAGRFKQMIHITLPELSSTIILMLILSLGEILISGTEQVLMMYNPVVYETGDIIGSYVYRMGIGKMEYSFTTAVGLFESLVGFVLVLSGNALSRKLLDKGMW